MKDELGSICLFELFLIVEVENAEAKTPIKTEGDVIQSTKAL